MFVQLIWIVKNYTIITLIWEKVSSRGGADDRVDRHNNFKSAREAYIFRTSERLVATNVSVFDVNPHLEINPSLLEKRFN